MTQKKGILLGGIVVTVILIIIGFVLVLNQPHEHHDSDNHHEDFVHLSDEELKTFNIQIEEVKEGVLIYKTIFPAEVQIHLDHLALVKLRYSGVVRRIVKHIGDHVKRGEILATIESNENLSRYHLKAPISGTIIKKQITIGESIAESSIAFTMANLNKVWVSFSISQDYLGQVKTGQSATVFSDGKALSKRTKVRYVSDVLDHKTRTLTGRLTIRNSDRRLKPGMYVDVLVEMGRIEGDRVISKSAIQTYEGQTHVFVQADGGFHLQPVSLGEEDSDKVIVLDGLKNGDWVVSKGSFIMKAELEKESFGHGHAH